MTNEAVLEADVKKQWIIAQYPRSQLMVSDKSLRLVIELPAELSRAVFSRIGHGSIIGDSGFVAVMPANAELYQEFLNSINGKAAEESADLAKTEAKKKGEHGDYARKLYTSGFFLHEEVLEALGKNSEFLDWIREQPSCVSDTKDYWRTEDGRTGENCEASHVERVHAGHGKGIKADFCAVPLTHDEHATRHGVNGGELAVLQKYMPAARYDDVQQAKEWFWRQRCEYVTKWAKMRLKAHFKAESLADIDPAHLHKWGRETLTIAFMPQIPKAGAPKEAGGAE